jgi:1-aminocyclopropane-1-carboxylate deaminase/D-cysteine desulfhydrase-like pyridoxal-dependent ACC family enzyme
MTIGGRVGVCHYHIVVFVFVVLLVVVSLSSSLLLPTSVQSTRVPSASRLRPLAMSMRSIITKTAINNRVLYIKRDDLRNLHGLTGNKSRKFQHLLEKLTSNTEGPPPQIVASYGGVQSNAMVALAKLVHTVKQQHSTQTQFHYFTRQLPSMLRSIPTGNYQQAINCGMKVHELSSDQYSALASMPLASTQYDDLPHSLRQRIAGSRAAPDCLWIPQGGAMADASVGVNVLVDEIVEDIEQIRSDSDDNKRKKWKVSFFANLPFMWRFNQLLNR